MSSDDDYRDISNIFMDKHTERNCSVRYFPNRQISTICETYDNPDTEKIETKIMQPGMNREELLRYFTKANGKINLAFLVRSIIYEAYEKEALLDGLERGNVRHFWYTHLKTVILRILGLSEATSSIKSTIGTAWKWLIDSGAVTYEEMNVYSDKESGRLSIVKDSPFTNIIIAVEKQNFYDTFQWIPRLFNCTLITAGGQPSRAVTRRFIYELQQDGVDLDQTFHMCIASDLDCSGYDIEGAFKDQFVKAIEYYGGTGNIEIHRLFVRKDQVTPELLKAQGIAWQPDKKKNTRDTIWKHFCEKTDGGLYITLPDGWTGDVFEIDGKPMVRALLEMDAFSTSLIEKSLVNELLKIIRENSDETKILIPEIMRVFNEIKNDISGELFERWNRELIDPLKEEFLKDTAAWKDFIDEKEELDIEKTNDKYNDLVSEKEDEKRDRVPELFDEEKELGESIAALETEKNEKIREIVEEYKPSIDGLNTSLESVDEDIDEKCEDIDDEIEGLKSEKDEELETIDEEYDFRMTRYNQFKEEHVAVFNPVEQALRQDIDHKLEEMDYRFRTLEKRDEIKKEIGSICINIRLLTDENISCFDQPVPTFKGDKYLEKASYDKDLNIGNVRDSFSQKFLGGMKRIWRDDTVNFDFELSKTVEMKDLSQEVKEAMDDTEKAVDEEI